MLRYKPSPDIRGDSPPQQVTLGTCEEDDR